MKKIVIILLIFIIPRIAYSQFESRLHLLGGGNLKVSNNSYQFHKNYVLGGEAIIGFRIGYLFLGVGAGAEYTGTDAHYFEDSINKINIYNLDIPLFLDLTIGKRFYVETKLGYSVKSGNIKKHADINTNTLFAALGLGYSFPMGKSVYFDLAVEAKYNYISSIDQNDTKTDSHYVMPVAKIGFRFVKNL